jgi:hypothetical protein
LCLKRRWSDFDPQAYDPYGEDQNHETSFKGKALQAAVGSWCKIQVIASRFTVQARPGATLCVDEIVFTVYALGFQSLHLDIPGLGQGFKDSDQLTRLNIDREL